MKQVKDNAIEGKLEEMKKILQEKGMRPIFFIGSGLSRRYLNSPNWEGLLKKIAGKVGHSYEEIANLCNDQYEEIAQELEYYCFRHADDSKLGEGRRAFLRDTIAEIFKYYKEEYKGEDILEKREEFNEKIYNKVNEIGNLDNSDEKSKLDKFVMDYDDISKEAKKYSEILNNVREITELRKINPKAIITTNYDTLLEDIVFADRCIRHIGQDGFKDNLSEAEDKIDLYKIHGCVTKPKSIIITKEDYDNFFQKSRYLYSKILTLFWEYPVIFIGYSVSDRNIKDILAVMIEIMTEEQKEDFLKRIWIVDFAKHEDEECVTEREIELLNGKRIKIPCFFLKYYLKLYQTINTVLLSQRFGQLNFTISENVIELLIEPLYQQQDKLKVVVRELLQNALDACKKKRAQKNEKIGLRANIKIEVKSESNGGNYLEIKDNGIGMDLHEVKENFLTVGKTNKKNNCEGLVGKYGIGILSVFLIGNYAEVYTKKENGELLSLKIYIRDDKKQVGWLEPKRDDIDNNIDSFTIIRIYLKDSFKIERGKNALEILGLESYFTKPENSISVNFDDEKYDIPKIEKNDWFLSLTDDIQIFQLGYKNEDDKLEDSQLRLKNIMDKKGLILYNDMVSSVVYDKGKYIQLSHINIPFVLLDVKNTDEVEEDIKTSLSRSVLQISGAVMNQIAKGIYQLEVNNVMEVIQNSRDELGKDGTDIYDLLKNIRNSSEIMEKDIDIIMYNRKLFFSKESNWEHIRVCGREKFAEEFCEGFLEKPVIYDEATMNKSDVSDIIEEGRLICISQKYLEDYIFNATSQHNGLRKQALIKILNCLGETAINEKKWIKEIWDDIKENKENLKEKCSNKVFHNILWLESVSKSMDNINVGDDYFIIYKAEKFHRNMDDDFCEILKSAVQKESLGDIIGIYEEMCIKKL